MPARISAAHLPLMATPQQLRTPEPPSAVQLAAWLSLPHGRDEAGAAECVASF